VNFIELLAKLDWIERVDELARALVGQRSHRFEIDRRAERARGAAAGAAGPAIVRPPRGATGMFADTLRKYCTVLRLGGVCGLDTLERLCYNGNRIEYLANNGRQLFSSGAIHTLPRSWRLFVFRGCGYV
jgi:hypothetical protein